MKLPKSNFAHLAEHDEQLVRLGMLAERYFAEDPNTTLLKLRQLAELLAQMLASKVGIYTSSEESQYDLLRRLQDKAILPREVYQLFNEVRRVGNAANHAVLGDHRQALSALKLSWQMGVWFHRTFKDPAFRSGPFIPPSPPKDESGELRLELEALRKILAEQQTEHQQTIATLSGMAAQLHEAKNEQAFWEQMAVDVEKAKADIEQRLAAEQEKGKEQPKARVNSFVAAATTAAESVQLDEAETRRMIDEQLRSTGWTVDTAQLSYRREARPEKGKNLAIAEWPTASGPADYVLFVGLMPVAIIEAKRRNIDVSAALQQAKRYSRSFSPDTDQASPGGPWQEFRIPFVFSTNARPFARQLAIQRGIWFCDLRNPEYLSHPLDGWYTPEGLVALLKRDEGQAHEQLRNEPFNYGFKLRDYQQNAILAAEAAIAEGKREMLLAMATGTGKTKTCIALIYRLLKARRFRRILFLVDRAALGEQAANAFKDTRMESLQSFADVFGIKELDEQQVDTDTLVHIATVQGLVQRVLYPSEGKAIPTVDQYDCIVVDECHRGYLLDREMSETEMGFRTFEEYISKYRRILDYFDAVKIGLTATPAKHTSDLFGLPIFVYGYREAVIDGYLVDHEPPSQIFTKLSSQGIVWKAGEQVQVYNPHAAEADLFTTPDEIHIEVEEFNRKVITEQFNRVVCGYLAGELDPSSRQKTLIYCVNDVHADLVVKEMKDAFAARYGVVEDDAVMKITGAADKPLGLIRRYKNERNPNVAVTVDLLTTGIDVPEICNLVFLRRVSSRILFEQMLGRATRLCEEIGKEVFRIFDAVRIYEALQSVSSMLPVAVNPYFSFAQLTQELATVQHDKERVLVRDQFIAKLQRKQHHLGEAQRQDFESQAGMPPDAFIKRLRKMPLPEIAEWFVHNPGLGEILDRKASTQRPPVYLSDHPDELLAVERGYGKGQKPEDYLKAFSEFLRTQGNQLPALRTVLTRPRELTRKDLRALALALDRAGYAEATLSTAWREMTNQDIAARIVGYIRQAAIGDPLLAYEERVDRALRSILASRQWSSPQRQWLQRIASQTKANTVVDRAAIDDPDLIFKREGGGFTRLDRIFTGELQQVLDTFNEAIWSPAA